LLPVYDPDWLRKATAELCYCQHGGSGFQGFTPEAIAAMGIDDIEFYMEWLDERRRAESNAIKKANRAPRGR